MQHQLDFGRTSILLVTLLTIAACGTGQSGTTPALPAVDQTPLSPSSPETQPTTIAKPTPREASRFLMSATFGPNSESIDQLSEIGYSDWMKLQYQLPMRSIVDASLPNLTANTDDFSEHRVVISEFYENAILGEDQLRMRTTYALSQLFVVSTLSGRVGSDGEGLARYVDILQEGAFGNFRDLLEEVTYSPVMGEYLTYAGNRKSNPATGYAPDENYAREILQLFTIGLYELNLDGTLKLDGSGQPIETYTNEDISELAKVFTGLWFDGLPFGLLRHKRTERHQLSRMTMFELEHSDQPKTFLGETLTSTLSGEETISAALDILFEHPNTAPFVSRQLIQRMTTSNPSPEYVRRVAEVFNTGSFRLPSGDIVGTGDRGDLRAVWAAILLDSDYLSAASVADPSFGKVREPVILFTHWARMSEAPAVDLLSGGGNDIVDGFVINQHYSSRLGQRPFTSPSVFNFYRPNYTAAGSQTARAGLVAPELQITTTNSVISYANFMRTLVFRDQGATGANGALGLVGDYSAEIEIAENSEALIDRLNLLLLAGTLSDDTKRHLKATIESVSYDAENTAERLRDRVQLAIQLIMVSPEYMVQQ